MRRSTGILTLGLILTVALAACGDSGGTSDTTIGDDSASLVGRWAVVTYASGGAMVPAIAGTSPEVEFLDDGSVVGFTGCNRFNATWTGGRDDLGITPLATTRMACVDAAASAQEQALVSILPTVTGWRPVDGGAELLGTDGAPLVELVPARD